MARLPYSAQRRIGNAGGPVAVRKRFSFWIDTPSAKREASKQGNSKNARLWQELKAVDVGELAFMWVRGNAVDVGSVVHSRMKDAASHPLYLVLKLNTFTTNETNDLVLVDADRFLKLRSPACTDMWFIGLPHSLVTRWLPGTEGPVAKVLKGHEGWSGVLSAYVRGLDFNHLQGVASPFEQELLGEHVLSMLSFALFKNGLKSDADPSSARNRALHGDMCRWIRNNYADPDISAAKLADQVHSSARYVHKVFADAGGGMTFRDTVQQVRLEVAAQMLRAPSTPPMTVAQIAHRCGFSDPAYFGFVFRKQFGCTPRGLVPTLAAPPDRAAP
jgi:AraC-like DNA-binding protein